jgi:outer membrane lipoprotein carrier protein
MNPISKGWIRLVIVSATVLSASLASAQPNPPQPQPQPRADAATVAAQVQTFYDQTRSVQARFHQTFVNKLYNRTDRSRGRVVFSKPGKMRWTYDAPNGKIIVSDGRQITIYEPGENGAAGQYWVQGMGDSQLTSALGFLTGTGRLERDFSFRLLDARRQGFPDGHVLELRPRRANPHYDRVLFYVDAAAATRGLVRRVLIIDAAGNRNRFDFTYARGAFNANIGADQFRFTPPTGSRRIPGSGAAPNP